MIDKDIRIAIIGGGIAGFASGVSLIKNGYKNVRVFERDEHVNQRRQGYGLTILQGISALKKLDVYETVYDIDTPSRSHFIFDYQGNLVGFFGTIFWPSPIETALVNNPPKNNKKHNLHLSRQDLRTIILDKYYSVHPNKENAIEWKKKLENIRQDTNSEKNFILEFSDNTTYEADLVIGSDGINSVTRKFKYPTGDKPLNFLGILLVLGISNTQHQLGDQRVFQTVDGHCRLFAMPFSKTDPTQNIMWQLSFPLDEVNAKRYAKDSGSLKSFLLEKCGHWHEPIPEMIKNTELNLLMGIAAYDRDIMEADGSRPIVLLGDAAHPMSPFKGQGANQALLDACELTECLNKSTDLSAGILDFEVKMNKRVMSKVMLSRERVTTYHQADILNTENFLHRGVDEQLLEVLKQKCINAQTPCLEDAILNEMKQLNRN